MEATKRRLKRPKYGGYERRPKRPRNDRHDDRPQPLVEKEVDKEGRHFTKFEMTARLGHQKGEKAQVVKEPRAAHYRNDDRHDRNMKATKED